MTKQILQTSLQYVCDPSVGAVYAVSGIIDTSWEIWHES